MPGWILPLVQAGASLAGNLLQRRENKKIAEHQATINERYLKQQQEYNTPKNQMARFQEAGLNPNLIYGQGNPGNQSAPLNAPERKPTDIQNLIPGALQLLNQTRLQQSQIGAIDANTVKTQAQTSLANLQAQVLAKNPLLDPSGFNAIIESLKATAETKAAQSTITNTQAAWMKNRTGRGAGSELTIQSNWAHRMDAELNNLEQKFNLGTTDGKIKAEILNSKQFQNAILDIQRQFLVDGEVGPQQILQFVQLLLMKML